jgi:pilus assembly protein CpaF
MTRHGQSQEDFIMTNRWSRDTNPPAGSGGSSNKPSPNSPENLGNGGRSIGPIPIWSRQGQGVQPASAGSDFSKAFRASRVEVAPDKSPYDTVLDNVKEELKYGQALPSTAYENPSEDDYRLVKEIAKQAVQAYNHSAPTNGVDLLIDAPEEELGAEIDKMAKRIADDVLGWGPIAPYMSDSMVEEIFINGAGQVFVQRAGERKQPTSSSFRSPQQLRNFVNNKLDIGSGARTVTSRVPWRDHRLSDGSRIHVIMDPLVANLGMGGMAVTIRRFRSVARTLDDLLALGSLSLPAANLLKAVVQGQLNICISGGTGTGKTTFLTALTSEIDQNERTVTVEDTPELQLPHLPDWVQLITRERAEGAEPVIMADLVRHCLRMRPKRILLGEARGAEMVAILEAMNTGHDGCMFTVHADDAFKTLQRIETLYLKSNMQNVPLFAIRREIASAVNVIVNIGVFRTPDGTDIRRVKEINYVAGNVEKESPITSEPIFSWVKPRGGEDWQGHLEFTGAYPELLVQRLETRARWFNWERDLVEASQEWK